MGSAASFSAKMPASACPFPGVERRHPWSMNRAVVSAVPMDVVMGPI